MTNDQQTPIDTSKATSVGEDSLADRQFRPSDFMRARRPELYSDSKRIVQQALTRELLEYQLETLTSRKQEADFEHFCRRLAEKEICPNLRPQTGPTGGGDSKADAETYPVSVVIAERWFEGLSQEAASERWAFAFSAKEDWVPKVKEDVRKVAETKRGYRRIFFITSRFTRDKKRADLEDELSKQYEIAITILDRNWILDRVFNNNREALAIESLHLRGFESVQTLVPGPKDIQRQQELNELDENIADSDRYQSVDYQLADDCLQSALLARALGYARTEVEGRFARAERIAKKIGHEGQQLRIAYARAWTAFWWYDDLDHVNTIYEIAEGFALRSAQATDLELLANLWLLLKSTVSASELTKEETKLEQRSVALNAALEQLSADKNRPNNALFARSISLMLALPPAIESGEQSNVDALLIQFKDVLEESQNLGAFPLETISNLIREFGSIFAKSPIYDDLFEHLVNVLEKRKSQGEAGRLLAERGFQKLEAKQQYDAIRLLGRASGNLIKREYRDELVAALVGCALAYEHVGLLWAARMNILAATSMLLSDFIEHGTIPRNALRCILKLVWIELQLGRVPCVLCWAELAGLVAHALKLDDARQKKVDEERTNIDGIFAMLILRTPLAEAQNARRLPNVLERLGLPFSAMATLYLLGHESALRDEGWIPDSESDEDVRRMFLELKDQPAKEDIPAQPNFLAGDQVRLESIVLGARVAVISQNNLVSIQVAEAILSTLEAFLATSLGRDGLLPYREELKIEVRPSMHVTGVPEIREARESGEEVIRVEHSPNSPEGLADRRALRNRMMEVVARVVPRIAVAKDIDQHLEKIVRDEEAFARSLTFSEISVSVENILGSRPKLRLEEWEADETLNVFAPMRKVAWDEDGSASSGKPRKTGMSTKFGEGEPPERLRTENIRHDDRKVVSIIDIPLWDKAKWRGVLFAHSPDSYEPPVLGLLYEEAEAGQEIFRGLTSKLGKIDVDEKLRLAILTGIDERNRFAYSTIVTSNLDNEERQDEKQVVTVARMQRMYPPDDRNLNGFLERFNRTKRYWLVPAGLAVGGAPKIFWEHAIAKRKLSVRPAWQIGDNDPDMIALMPDDLPIIPEGIKEAPVKRTLERIKRRES